jgi:hypothetical protein
VGGDPVGDDDRARTTGVQHGDGREIEIDTGDVAAVEQGHDRLAELRCMLHLQLTADQDADDARAFGIDLQHLGRPLLGHGRSWVAPTCVTCVAYPPSAASNGLLCSHRPACVRRPSGTAPPSPG